MLTPAKVLAYLGLLPFVFLPLAIATEGLAASVGYSYFVQYSAIILSFFGGIHWFIAISNQANNHQLYVAMLPSIIGWLAIVLFFGKLTLTILSIAYIGILIYDKFTIELSKHLIIQYITMRVILTSVVVVCHTIMLFLL